MPRSVENWADRTERSPVKTVFQLVALGVILVVAVMAALWGLGVVTAPWKGAGDAYQQKNSAQNWVAAQRQFHQDQNDVQADQAKIAAAKTALNGFRGANPAPTGDAIAYQQWSQQEANYQTTLTGLQQQCQNTVASYDTDAQSYLTENWRDADLPPQLDPSACD
jgi:hypothetical protein